MPISCLRKWPYSFNCRATVRDGCARDGEAQAFVSAGLGEDEGVHAHDFAAHVHQRTAGISGIDRRVGLDIDERRIGIDLSGDGRNHTVGDGISQAFGAAEGEDGVPPAARRDRKRGSGRETLCHRF